MSSKAEPLRDEGTRNQVVFAGAVAGLVSRFCIAPLDVVKIRLQLQSQTRQPQGTFATFRSLIQTEGVRSLWKGNIPAEALYLAYGSVQFLTYRTASQALDALPDGYRLSGTAVSFVAGATAGTVATTATYPLDLLRTRFAAQGTVRVYSSLRASVTHIWQHEGVRGYYRGLGAGLSQIVPYMGLFFSLYETAKAGLAGRRDSLPLDWLGSADAVAGIVASVVSKTCVFPLDTVRKRLQVQGPTRTGYAHGSLPVYASGVSGTLRQIVKTEGFRGLYRGLGVGLLKAAPASAVTVWTFERTMDMVRGNDIF